MANPAGDPSDQFVNRAEAQRGAIEELIKGLPGLRGYIEKETRRDADKRLRLYLVGQLDADRQQLYEIQQKLLKRGGLSGIEDVDRSITKLQTLSDTIRTASYGYAGFFDTVRVREEALRALYQFDVAIAESAGKIRADVTALDNAVDNDGDVAGAVAHLLNAVQQLAQRYDRRNEAILAPETLLTLSNAPDVDPELMIAADAAAGEAPDSDSNEA
jgi:hypothetical protein